MIEEDESVDIAIRLSTEEISEIGGELGDPHRALLAAIIHQAVLDARNGSQKAYRWLCGQRARSMATMVNHLCLEYLDDFLNKFDAPR